MKKSNNYIFYIFLIIVLLLIIYYFISTNNIKEKFETDDSKILTEYKNAEAKLGDFCTKYKNVKPLYCKNCYDMRRKRKNYLNCFIDLNNKYGSLLNKNKLTEQEMNELTEYNNLRGKCIKNNCKI